MPDDGDLLTIGDFARAVGLPASALRHYDDCGLLVPARTDASTGYRYYTPALERRARLIAGMREVGVPIDTMRLVLDGDADRARAVLDGVTADREQQAQRTRAALAGVLATLEADRVPDLARLRVGGPELAAALRQVRTAADTPATSAMAAVLLDVRDGELDVVATNRHWMTRRTLPVAAPGSGQARAVLPMPVVAELVERLDGAGDVDAVLHDGSLTLELGDESVVVGTSERPFPSYRLVLDALEAPTATALVSREALVEAVTSARRSVVPVCAGERLEVAGGVPDAVVRGRSETVRFRSALLLRAVASCVGERVLLALAAPDRPAQVSSPDQPGFTALVMPTLEQG